MKTTIPFMLAILTACAVMAQDKKDAPRLGFFVVSESKVESGRYIDTQDVPKLGFIRPAPDLVLTQLEAVARTRSGSIVMDKDKPIGISESRHDDTLDITMSPEDAQKFGELTKSNIGSRILLMLDDIPLFAPMVLMPMRSTHFQITFGNEQTMQKVEKQLRTLVKVATTKQ